MLMGAHVVGTVNVVSVLAMAPVIQQALDLSATEVGLLMTAYYSGQATWSLPAGAFVDRAGVGRILMMAMAGIAVGTSVVATARGLPMLLLGMYLMGSGYSFTNPSTAKGVFDWFPQRRRATAMGAKQTGVPIGGVIAAGLGALAAATDWRLIFDLCRRSNSGVRPRVHDPAGRSVAGRGVAPSSLCGPLRIASRWQLWPLRLL